MGFAIVALAPTGELTLEAFAATLSADARLALVAGAEGYGLSTATIAAADVTVRIPVDPHSDSLNVVVAVSIALQRVPTRTSLSPGTPQRPTLKVTMLTISPWDAFIVAIVSSWSSHWPSARSAHRFKNDDASARSTCSNTPGRRRPAPFVGRVPRPG